MSHYADYAADIAGVGDGPVAGPISVTSDGSSSEDVVCWGVVTGVTVT